MHDVWQLSGQVPVAGLHLIVILLLIFFDESLVHSQRLTTGIHKLPEERHTGILVQKSFGPKTTDALS